MTTQTTLFTPETSSGPSGDLFFAIRPDPTAVAQIAALTEQLRAQHQLKAKAIKPERLHVTLHYIGSYEGLSDDVVATASKAMDAVTAAPFEIMFNHAYSFPRGAWGKPFVLGMREPNTALTQLYQQLYQPLKASGFGKTMRSAYTPHVTLLYDKTLVADTNVEPVSWRVDEVMLLISERNKGHTLLRSWPLRR